MGLQISMCASTPSRESLSPSAIAQFYKLQQCPMYLYHRYVDEDFTGLPDIPLSPLLAATGEKFEEGQVKRLLDADVYSVGEPDSTLPFDEAWTGDYSEDVDRLGELVGELADGARSRPIVFFQPRVAGTVGAWPVKGAADVVIASPGASTHGSNVELRVVEVKSSSAVQTHHQLQAAIYSLLFESLLNSFDTDITASIVSQDPEYNDLVSVVTSTGGIDLRRLSTFELSTRQNDVQLLLETGGTVDDILLEGNEMREGGDPPRYRIDARCDGCPKQIRCVAHSVTSKHLSLLGLTEGVQESLADLGVTDLRDLATLYEWPTGKYGFRATSHAHPDPADPDLVSRITRETEISNLRNVAQIAHRFLREIDPEYASEWNNKAEGGPWGDYLIGTGRNLPDDDPYGEFDLDYPRQSLVRVYPYVQHDTVRNRLVFLGAKVTSTHYEQSHDDGVFVAARPEGHPNDPDSKDEEERRLIEDFYEKLSTAIEEVRPDLTDEDYGPTEGFIHLYPYGNSQRRSLVDAVKRHPGSEAAGALRTLLGYREAIDQEVVSVLREEFRERHAFRYPGLGVVQTAAQFWCDDSDLDWERPRDPSKTPLKDTFASGFFEVVAEYDELADRIVLDFDDGLTIPDDHMNDTYPVVGRHQEVLPLEYIYASEEFDLLRPELAEDEQTREQIFRYRHHTDEDSPRITLDDIEDAVQSICEAYEHIERCIRDKDASVTKRPLNLANLTENSLGESALQSTCLEYQDLEYGAQRRNIEATYRKSLSERVGDGSAIPFEVTTPPVESEDPDERRDWLEGSVLRSLTPGREDGLQPHSQPSREAGDFVVLTPLTDTNDGGLTDDVDDPVDIKHKVLGKLTHLDTESGTVRVSLNWRRNQSRKKFRPNHVGWTNDPDDEYNRQVIDEGDWFVVDAALDDFVAHHAHQALRRAHENDVHNRLVNVYDDEIPDALEMPTPLFDRTAVDRFVDVFDAAMPESTNPDQESFITRLHHTVAALQGPPGTGKTQYASAPAVLSRAYAAGPGFVGVASAHSNTAVDELAEAVAESQQALSATGDARDVTLIRVRSGSASGDLPETVREYSYYDDRDELNDLLAAHLDGQTQAPLVIFTTPVTLRNLVHGATDVLDGDAESAEQLMERGKARLFDFALVDEASMMDLPLLFLLGAFLGRNKQLLLVGDHRQMQPIQQHDWEAEDRQTIEENTPSVSALDFVRFLRGEEDSDFERLEREPPTWPDKQSVLPMDRLQTTYRLPPAMARFVTDLFYHRDDIDLQSGASAELMPDVRSAEFPDWLNVALDPEFRVTLLIHDDNVLTKDSPLEAHLLQRLFEPLPVVRDDPADGEVTGGLVVPFRLMRRRLQTLFDITVDTVERFQGAERDVMVLSMTAGNQGYVNQIDEFLLDANRFNVGASRMKRKLFVVASKSLFRAVSDDPQKYDQQKAWKQLYQALVAGSEPDAHFTVPADDVDELNTPTNVEVYTGYVD